MRKSLFALENADELGQGVEMEASAEEGEVADVGMDVEAEAGEIDDVADAVSDGTDAADQMEEVEALVADAAENGEGLDPVAAEAVRISVEAICARIGANPKAVYSLYATENFASASSRKANTRIALEGVGEFLKDLWKRIKAALTNMWKKVKDFWAKHVSSLGRVKKALEATKVKVKASSGKLKGAAFVEKAPGALTAAFAGKGPVDAKRVKTYIDAQSGFTGMTSALGAELARMKDFNFENFSASDMATQASDKVKRLKDASQTVLIIGGESLTIKSDIDDEGKSFKLEIEKDTTEEADPEAGMVAGSKDDLSGLLDASLVIIKAAIQERSKAEKVQSDTSAAMSKIEAIVAKDTVDAGSDAAKALRTNLAVIYKLNAVVVKVQGIAASQNIRMAKSVIAFTAASLKQYK